MAFISSASDLAAGDDNGGQDLFVYDAQTGGVRLVSEGRGGETAASSGFQRVLNDGTVYFLSSAADIADVDTNSNQDLFRWNPSGSVAGETLVGGSGPDFLQGNGGTDTLQGNGGDDVLVGRGRSDALTGGPGSDRFHYKDIGDGLDTVTDFDAGEGDMLDLREILVAYNGNASSYIQMSASGGDTLVSVNADGAGNDFYPLAVLEGVSFTATLLNDLVANGNLVLS